MKQSVITKGVIGAASTLINPVLLLKLKPCLSRRAALAQVKEVNAVPVLTAAVATATQLHMSTASASEMFVFK